MDLDAVGLIGLRLGEHAMHTWDVAVIADPAAQRPGRRGGPADRQRGRGSWPRGWASRRTRRCPVHLTVTGPDRDWTLTATADSVTVTDGPADGTDGAGAARCGIPAEALLRLAYGRLDPAHTPDEVEADPAVLDRLRAVFPGF